MIRVIYMLLYEVNLKGDFNMTLIIITLIASFIGGCTYAILKNKREVEQAQAELLKRHLLPVAISGLGISQTEYVSLCTAFGVEKANEMIIERWKINNN